MSIIELENGGEAADLGRKVYEFILGHAGFWVPGSNPAREAHVCVYMCR